MRIISFYTLKAKIKILDSLKIAICKVLSLIHPTQLPRFASPCCSKINLSVGQGANNNHTLIQEWLE